MEQVELQDFFDTLSKKSRERRMPEGVTFELTYGCNLRCLHCYNPTHRVLPGELTTREVCEILDQVADLGVINLTFSGGELFTRPDALDILSYAKRLGLLLYLISNATRITPSIAHTLEDIRFENINLSIYGASKQTYERVTRATDSYESLLRGLESLAGTNLPVVVCMPLMTANVDEVDGARALVESYGFKFRYSVEITPRTDGNTEPLRYRLGPAEKMRVNQRMVGHTTASPKESCATGQEFISCSCGRSRFAITPYGEMNLCVAFPIPKYDLRKGTVREGWEVLKETVDQAKSSQHDQCPTCDVRPYCRQGRSDAWLETGDMSVCLPHFKEFASLEKRAHEYLDPRRPA